MATLKFEGAASGLFAPIGAFLNVQLAPAVNGGLWANGFDDCVGSGNGRRCGAAGVLVSADGFTTTFRAPLRGTEVSLTGQWPGGKTWFKGEASGPFLDIERLKDELAKFGIISDAEIDVVEVLRILMDAEHERNDPRHAPRGAPRGAHQTQP